MPDMKVKLSGRAVALLQERVNDFNLQTGQSLALEEWLSLHLREIAIGKGLRVREQGNKEAVDLELAHRNDAARRELLEELEEPPA